MSVTGFIKNEIHHSSFDAPALIRKLKIDDNPAFIDFDVHILKAMEWKYSALFGSLFHAIVEYFFHKVVNGCSHALCRSQVYSEQEYFDVNMEASNNYLLSRGKLSQAPLVHVDLRKTPVMPCICSVDNYDAFVAVVTDEDNFAAFLSNNAIYNIDSEKYKKEVLSTIETAFDCNKASLRPATARYRKLKEDTPYEQSIDKIIQYYYQPANYAWDLKRHLEKFYGVVMHLPLNEFCDIRPEYIVFSEERGLAGSVDLTMRSRSDPSQLYVYDWKTCKKIFNSFRRGNEMTSQLMDYSCQLHTYANLMKECNPNLKIELFVVNITCEDFCVYNVRSFANCAVCHDVFLNFNKKMKEI